MGKMKIVGIAFWLFVAYVVVGAVFLPAAPRTPGSLGTMNQVVLAALGLAWFLAVLGASASGMVYLASRAAGALGPARSGPVPAEEDNVVPFRSAPEPKVNEPHRKARAS